MTPGSGLKDADTILYGSVGARGQILPTRILTDDWRKSAVENKMSGLISTPFYGNISCEGASLDRWCGDDLWALRCVDNRIRAELIHDLREGGSEEKLPSTPSGELYILIQTGARAHSRHQIRDCEIEIGSFADPTSPLVDVSSEYPGDKSLRRYQAPLAALQLIEDFHGQELTWLCYHGPIKPAHQQSTHQQTGLGNHALIAYDDNAELIGVVRTSRV